MRNLTDKETGSAPSALRVLEGVRGVVVGIVVVVALLLLLLSLSFVVVRCCSLSFVVVR